jgi:hypothetical protein
MTSEKELRQIARKEVVRAAFRHMPLWEDYPDLAEAEWVRVVDLASEWPIPDLPEPDYEHAPAWSSGNMYIEPGKVSGEVRLTYPNHEDISGGGIDRQITLTPAQVQAIIAAHYHREDQE